MQNTNQTKAAVAIFLKVNFKTRKFTSDKKKTSQWKDQVTKKTCT